MKKVYLFLADGFEEIEGLTVVDLLRRAGIDIITVSITGEKMIHGSHGIHVEADALFEDFDYEDGRMLVLPGGMPGTTHLDEHGGLQTVLRKYDEQKKWITAICAAPIVLSHLGILSGKMATCYPARMQELVCKEKSEESVVVDGHIITSRGMGTAVDFALMLIESLLTKEKAEEIAKSVVYQR